MRKQSLVRLVALLALLALLAHPIAVHADSTTHGGFSTGLAGTSVYLPLTSYNPPAQVPSPAPSGSGVYWGITMKDVPWDMNKLAAWEEMVGKRMSIVHYWQFWNQDGAPRKFNPNLLNKVRDHGAIPMITWPSEKMGSGTNQPEFQLGDIIGGQHDEYLRQWATDAKAWGHPFFLRWGHEMNGDWFPWGETANGNSTGQFVQAWRHIHDIFSSTGATNASWVWCPNVEFPGSPWPTFASLYPGDDYVDWTCLDGYNWGSNYPRNGGWISFTDLYSYAYGTLMDLAPSKPVMIGEFASHEEGGSKAGWITDVLSTQIPNNFPRIKAQVWNNCYLDNVDWRVESSQSAIDAWREAIALPYYRANVYGTLSASPIPQPQ